MAASQTISLSLLHCLLFFFFFFAFALSGSASREVPSRSSIVAATVNSDTFWSERPPSNIVNAPKVTMNMYYESFCPHSGHFIFYHLTNLIRRGLMDIIDLKFVPFGNAEIYPNNTMVCQHGSDECYHNKVQACVIHNWPLVRDHFPIISCLMHMIWDYKPYDWEKCFEQLRLSTEPVYSCIDSGEAIEILRNNEKETQSLQPPKYHLPWIVVDGKPIDKDYYELETNICNAYNGTVTPIGCLLRGRVIPEITPIQNI